MSENVSKRTVSQAASTFRNRNSQVQSRGAVGSTLQHILQSSSPGRVQRETPRGLALSTETARSALFRRNPLPLVTNKSSVIPTTAIRGTVASGRVHSSALRSVPSTGTLRARTSAAALATADRGARAKTILIGRGGRLTPTNSSTGVRAALLSTSTTQKVQPRRSARLQLSVSTKTETQRVEEASTPPSVKRQSSLRRSSPGENVFYCPICYDNIKNTGGRIVVLPCGHVFCRDCLFTSFQKKKLCPLCQVAFKDPANIMEIFL